MYKTYCSSYFQSIRIDSVLGDDPVFMAISVCSVRGALHVFSHHSNRHPYISFGLEVFFMETRFTLWICMCSMTVFCQHSQRKLFSVYALSYTSVYCSRFKIWDGHRCMVISSLLPPPIVRNENSWILIFVSPEWMQLLKTKSNVISENWEFSSFKHNMYFSRIYRNSRCRWHVFSQLTRAQKVKHRSSFV